MDDWEQVKSLAPETKKMEKLIQGYSYATKQLAVITDENVCQNIVKGIRQAKVSLFNVIELLFEIEKEEPLSKSIQILKDELDIFSDEVKARYCDWKEQNTKWMIRLIKHDHEIVSGIASLNIILQNMYEELLRGRSLLSENELEQGRLWAKLKKQLPEIEERVDKLVTLFKEREGICNLKPMSLEKTFKSIQEKISKQI